MKVYRITDSDGGQYYLPTSNPNDTRYWDERGYTYEQVKVKRYSLQEISEGVKDILKSYPMGLDTTALARKLFQNEFFYTRETILKKLQEIYKQYDFLKYDYVNGGYVWYIERI